MSASKKARMMILLLFCISLLLNIYFFWTNRGGITSANISKSGELIGLSFTSGEMTLMKDDLEENVKSYKAIREIDIKNSVPPSIYFETTPPNFSSPGRITSKPAVTVTSPPVPENLEDLAFYPVTRLAALIRSRQITSVQLTEMYISRLKAYGPKLNCVITLTEELAMIQAKKADREIAAGKYRGPLHGIPWGAKDLLSTKGIKTTWGAKPYKEQTFDVDATVVQRLEEAGAVLVAKLSMGALAWGDVWFDGKTRNPWNPEQGSSGSSAGSASATAAGLVGFAIGTETWGSIISPSTRCGVTGLRPTFGRVSRFGAMALSWSMDKIGPICRSVEDCALVFEAINGPDGKDLSVKDIPFTWNAQKDLREIRVGYLKGEFQKKYDNKEHDQKTLQVLKDLGIRLVPIELPNIPVQPLAIILSAEAAAAFDQLTRSGEDDLLVRQIRNAWPNVFRVSRFIPAVEYIQANRIRTRLIWEMEKILKEIDVYIAPTFEGDNLLLTNLTGHPAVVVPNGFNEKGSPASITFMGNLFRENDVLLVAKAYQDRTDHHKKHPKLD